MGMATTDVALSVDVSITQAGLGKAEVGTAGVARVESGFSDEELSSAADPYARPRGQSRHESAVQRRTLKLRSLPHQLLSTY